MSFIPSTSILILCYAMQYQIPPCNPNATHAMQSQQDENPLN